MQPLIDRSIKPIGDMDLPPTPIDGVAGAEGSPVDGFPDALSDATGVPSMAPEDGTATGEMLPGAGMALPPEGSTASPRPAEHIALLLSGKNPVLPTDADMTNDVEGDVALVGNATEIVAQRATASNADAEDSVVATVRRSSADASLAQNSLQPFVNERVLHASDSGELRRPKTHESDGAPLHRGRILESLSLQAEVRASLSTRNVGSVGAGAGVSSATSSGAYMPPQLGAILEQVATSGLEGVDDIENVERILHDSLQRLPVTARQAGVTVPDAFEEIRQPGGGVLQKGGNGEGIVLPVNSIPSAAGAESLPTLAPMPSDRNILWTPDTAAGTPLQRDIAIQPMVEPVVNRLPLDSTMERALTPSIPAPTSTNGATVSATTLGSTVSQPTTSFPIDTPMKDSAWADALGSRVSWLLTRNIPSAELRLSPAELGTVQVQISVDDNTAKIAFSAGQAVAREALEAALPRLRDMFSDNGMTLADASVSDHKQEKQAGEEFDTSSGLDGAIDGNDAVDASSSSPPRRSASLTDGRVDTYV